MRRRFFPSRPGLWRHRFVQIAREADGRAAPGPGAPALGLRARPRPESARLGARATLLAA
jgi:hypothetical protein